MGLLRRVRSFLERNQGEDTGLQWDPVTRDLQGLVPRRPPWTRRRRLLRGRGRHRSRPTQTSSQWLWDAPAPSSSDLPTPGSPRVNPRGTPGGQEGTSRGGTLNEVLEFHIPGGVGGRGRSPEVLGFPRVSFPTLTLYGPGGLQATGEMVEWVHRGGRWGPGPCNFDGRRNQGVGRFGWGWERVSQGDFGGRGTVDCRGSEGHTESRGFSGGRWSIGSFESPCRS